MAHRLTVEQVAQAEARRWVVQVVPLRLHRRKETMAARQLVTQLTRTFRAPEAVVLVRSVAAAVQELAAMVEMAARQALTVQVQLERAAEAVVSTRALFQLVEQAEAAQVASATPE